MSSLLQKKWRFSLIFVIANITILLIAFVGFSFSHHTDRLTKADTGNDLLSLQKPDWHSYIELENVFIEMRRNWSDFGIKKKVDNGLELNEFVQTEFDRQIIKIKDIFSAEEDLKLAGLDQAFLEYAKKRRQTLDDFFQKRSININETLERELRQKEIETDQQILRYQYELEAEQRLSLVNLQLQLVIADLSTDRKGVSDGKETIQAKITAIKQAITQKVVLKKELLSKQLLAYEKQRRNKAGTELANLKISLETEFENDLTAYQAKLALNFNDWRQNQAPKFAKAIEIRRKQKNK